MLRGNLFIKIFLGFWLVTITILGSWMFASHYFETRAPELRERGPHPAGRPPRMVLSILYELQSLDEGRLTRTVEQAQQEHNITIYLLDRERGELLGRTVPPAVSDLAARLDGARRHARQRSEAGHMVAHEIFRRGHPPLRAVFVFGHPPGPIISALGGNLWLRIGLAVLVSGLACFALSRLMTNRLKELQQASRRLANGELDTRLQVRERGGDETDELARDFNSMASQLQERIQAQKRLLGDVSHELRSPLARLRIALALAQEGGGNPGQYLARIEHEAERLEELIAQLLSTQVRDIPLDAHIDLVQLLQQLCGDANFEGQGEDKRVLFSHDHQQVLVASAGDLLHKGFENILRNALGHTPPGSEISVELTSTPGQCRVTIEDQGPGVPEEELERLFDEFYRVDTARTREAGGYGLGLAIARRAVMQHRGELHAENTGSGLLIVVSLPIQE
jgi:two-component system sensor histidine kinase CpxA